MGRTYEAKKRIKDWDVNFAGANLLGAVNLAANTLITTDDGYHKERRIKEKWAKYEMRAVPWDATAEQTIEMADAIDKATDEQLLEVLTALPHLCGDTKEEFLKWCRDWAKWLRKSGGYNVQG